MRTLAALFDMLGWIWRRWLCEWIERVRPGYGHAYDAVWCDPPACRHCGCSRPALRRTR